MPTRLLFWKTGDTWNCVWSDTWTEAQGISCQRQIRTCRAAKKTHVLITLSEPIVCPECLTLLRSLCASLTHTPPGFFCCCCFLAHRCAPDTPVRSAKGTEGGRWGHSKGFLIIFDIYKCKVHKKFIDIRRCTHHKYTYSLFLELELLLVWIFFCLVLFCFFTVFVGHQKIFPHDFGAWHHFKCRLLKCSLPAGNISGLFILMKQRSNTATPFLWRLWRCVWGYHTLARSSAIGQWRHHGTVILGQIDSRGERW